MRILIIEDEKDLAGALSNGLERLGFAVDLAFDGLEGEQKALSTEYDLIILDVNLPEKDGIEVLKCIRSEGSQTSVLMLTARNKVSDKTLGLDSGADDYLTKPFSFDELRARVQALIRRSYGQRSPVLKIGCLIINPASRTASYEGQTIPLTAKEFDILEFLALKHPSVVSSEEVIEHIWSEESNPFSNSIRVHLANLRRKLNQKTGKTVIETIIGKGYKLWEC